ncbi:E3 ubiquitin-protein ligase ZSWIM2 [Pungitius pungitius]|uniref:E3 ubiquitin-protein ligase ZSWIM2 n=1 Tax=Pungitius pungitius TaxID=134920 RepID=UPI002E13ACD8
MFRNTTRRNTASEAVSLHQDQALNTTMFLLKSFGPTGFLLREDGEVGAVKVSLGDPHVCSCPAFTKEQEPCKHICWVLLRRFRLPREHEYSFQRGLVDRQILEVLHGLHQTKDQRTEDGPSAPGARCQAGSVCRKPIRAQDVCPICQEELLEKRQPVSHCRFGCGNNVHISCMKVWADHQRLPGRADAVKCPLCREDFSSLQLLQEQVRNAAKLFTASEREEPDRHLGVRCQGCRLCPVTGKCFKCTVCSHFYLCEACAKKGGHPQHPFASRTKRSEKWHFVPQDRKDEAMAAAPQSADDSIIPAAADRLPQRVLDRLPTVRVRLGSPLSDVGQQCRVCLQEFGLGQRVRILPCHHKFHADCVDEMLRTWNCCPLDGYVLHNRWTRRPGETKSPPRHQAKPPDGDLKDLFVPGVALRDGKPRVCDPSPPQRPVAEGLRCLCVDADPPSNKKTPQ